MKTKFNLTKKKTKLIAKDLKYLLKTILKRDFWAFNTNFNYTQTRQKI